jgi:hypothetical protein
VLIEYLFFYMVHLRMSRCGVNRWGPGTTCERPINTEASKEIQQRLASLEAERTRQDQIWTQASTPEQTIKNNSNLNQSNLSKSTSPKYTSS